MKFKPDYTPHYLHKHLSELVIGQENYLKKVSTTVWLHHRRMEANDNAFGNLRLQKHNLICVGPTGSGKTLAITTLAGLYDLDVLITDMSGYTGAGWKGRDVEQMILDLYRQCGRDKRRTERGIIVMDEIDKMILQNDHDRDPSFAAENALLKIIEGTTVTIEDNRHEVTINTTNILFIAAGAFEGIEYVVKKRVNAGKFGFKPVKPEFIVDEAELLACVEREDLLKYGMGAQFLGRFADIAVLHKLGVPELTEIVLHSKASVVRSLDQTLRRSCGLRVSMDEEGAQAVAEQAVKEGTGARGLAQIILPVINDTVFIVGSDETVSEILLTAKDGEPYVRLIEGKRTEKRWKPKCKLTFPAAKRKNVEHFSWLLLSVYLEEHPVEYRKMQAMHALLCNVVFFLLTACNPEDHTIESIQKLVKCAEYEPEAPQTTYEFIMTEDKTYSDDRDYMYYYKRYLILDQNYKCVPMLLQALEMFLKNPKHPQGNAINCQKVSIKEK